MHVVQVPTVSSLQLKIYQILPLLHCFKAGTKTPVFLRFSTVIHSKGSPETLRDPHGFAIKFYTQEGNWT